MAWTSVPIGIATAKSISTSSLFSFCIPEFRRTTIYVYTNLWRIIEAKWSCHPLQKYKLIGHELVKYSNIIIHKIYAIEN